MNELAVVIPFAGEFQYVDETLDSLFPISNIDEVVVAIDSTKINQIKAINYFAKRKAQFEKKSTRFKVVISTVNGPSAARNEAVKSTECEFILPIDCDDKISPSYPSLIKDILTRHEDIGIVYGQADLFDKANGLWILPKFSNEQMCLENCIYASGGFRRQDWLAVGGYDEKLIYGAEDWDFWLKLLSLGKKVHYIESEICFHYRIRNGSRSESFKGMWDQVIWTYTRICQNNNTFMASQIETIYRRRIELELENSSLKNISRNIGKSLLRRFPKLRRYKGIKFLSNNRKRNYAQFR